MVLLAFAAPARAQGQSLAVGVMAGGSLSTFTGHTLSDIKNYAGFIGGAFVQVGFAGFAIQPGLYYTTKGAKATDLGATPGRQTQLSYLQIPLVLRIGLGPLYVGAGPAIGINTGCKVTLDGGVGQCADVGGFDVNSTETSGIAIAGLQFGHVGIGARADLGITNAFHQDSGSVNIKTRTVSAVITIRF